MTPKIIEYENGRLKITAAAYSIKELHDIIVKYDADKELGCEPYIMYVDKMTAIDSPYINMNKEEAKEAAIYDVLNTIGDFDSDDPLIERAINRLRRFYITPIRGWYEELGQEIIRITNWMQENPIEQGKDGNLSDRMRMMQNAGSIMVNYKKAEQLADEETKAQTRGNQELGEY